MYAAVQAAETLLRAARTHNGHIAWPDAVGSKQISTAPGQWCNAQAGIGGFLARFWAATGEQRYADAAEQCANAVIANPWSIHIGACCGLAGVGHFLLDMAEISGLDDYRHHATRVAEVIHVQSVIHDGLLLSGDGGGIGADYAGWSMSTVD